MLMDDLKAAFAGRRVLVTGHTGFKGSWLSAWLGHLGAHVSGISLAPDQGPDNLFDRSGLADRIASHVQDIRDYDALLGLMTEAAPEVVFHLAAEPLVRRSYRDPLGTFATNVMGTAHVLEAARQLPGVKAVVCVTTDKVYDNKEWCWPYRETDHLGGADPYSASKSAAEMVARSYYTALRNETGYRMATARGGNVVGGGDWSEDRLVPDIVRAIRSDSVIELRHPQATRPWQHVLEPLSGYLLLAQTLYEQGAEFAEGWNFGPNDEDAKPVQWIVERLTQQWGEGASWKLDGGDHPHEAHYLKLDCSKAKMRLHWQPRWHLEHTLEMIVAWQRAWLAKEDMRRFTLQQIEQYTK
jgi:CDP-glucose 4,6-dehydratase